MRIAIIGAGCSGLTAIKNLVEAGLHDIVCFEQNHQIGGGWIYSTGTGHSSISYMTHTISSKSVSQFSDFPMPAHYPDYPSHQQILAYFKAYAKQFHLEQYIQFNTTVLHAERMRNGGWCLTLNSGTQQEFDILLVASGHLTVPRHPEWKDRFSGIYLHAHDFKTDEKTRNQRVLVIGAGNSGCDCAVAASYVAAQVDMSLRSPQYIIPKLIMGKPTDTFAASLQWLPQILQNWLQTISLRLHIGRYRDYGLPEPDFLPTQAHPTINSEIFGRIRHGKIFPRPGIREVNHSTVHFTDGSRADYDVVIAATGYRIHFAFFDSDLINWEEACQIPLYLRIFHPEHSNLCFVGLLQPQGCIWTLAEVQSRLIARWLTGKTRLPDNWQKQAHTEAGKWARQFIAHPRHALEVHYQTYLNQLNKAMTK